MSNHQMIVMSDENYHLFVWCDNCHQLAGEGIDVGEKPTLKDIQNAMNDHERGKR